MFQIINTSPKGGKESKSLNVRAPVGYFQSVEREDSPQSDFQMQFVQSISWTSGFSSHQFRFSPVKGMLQELSPHSLQVGSPAQLCMEPLT